MPIFCNFTAVLGPIPQILVKSVTAKFNGTNTLTSTAYSEVTIPNVTGVGSAPSLSYEEVTVPNVTSVGSVPSLSYEEVTVPNVTSVGTMTTVSVTGTTLNIINGIIERAMCFTR